MQLFSVDKPLVDFMGKRSNKNQMDLLSETQQNSRWFLGRRSYTSWRDMSDAEWARYIRNSSIRHPLDFILSIVFMTITGILLAVITITAIQNTGFSLASVTLGGFVILVCTYIVLYIKRYFQKN